MGYTQPTFAKKKKKALKSLMQNKDSLSKNDYSKIVKDGVKKKGLFTVIYKAKDKKLYFEIPDSAFSKVYMLSNRIPRRATPKTMWPDRW